MNDIYTYASYGGGWRRGGRAEEAEGTAGEGGGARREHEERRVGEEYPDADLPRMLLLLQLPRQCLCYHYCSRVQLSKRHVMLARLTHHSAVMGPLLRCCSQQMRQRGR